MWGHAGGADRRLSPSDAQMAEAAGRLLPALSRIADSLEGLPVPPSPMQAFTREPVAVAWGDLAPASMACGPGGAVAAIAHEGSAGALFAPHAVGASGVVKASPFSLRGLENLGRVLGASWDDRGLMLAHATGHLSECSGAPMAGGWRCGLAGLPKLPLDGAEVATIGRFAGGHRAATLLKDERTVVLLELRKGESEWAPAGEVSLDGVNQAPAAVALSADAAELLLALDDGSALKWPLNSPDEPTPVASVPSESRYAWRGTCGFGDGQLARLGWKQPAGGERGWVPEVFVSKSIRARPGIQ